MNRKMKVNKVYCFQLWHLLLYEALTNHTQVNDEAQQIKKTEMKQPQHMLSMKQLSVRHEVLIITYI